MPTTFNRILWRHQNNILGRLQDALNLLKKREVNSTKTHDTRISGDSMCAYEVRCLSCVSSLEIPKWFSPDKARILWISHYSNANTREIRITCSIPTWISEPWCLSQCEHDKTYGIPIIAHPILGVRKGFSLLTSTRCGSKYELSRCMIYTCQNNYVRREKIQKHQPHISVLKFCSSKIVGSQHKLIRMLLRERTSMTFQSLSTSALFISKPFT